MPRLRLPVQRFQRSSWSRVLAWPGMLSLVSVLAVLCGVPVPPEIVVRPARVSSDLTPPPLPELRAAPVTVPQPSPSPLPVPPVPEAFALAVPDVGVLVAAPRRVQPWYSLAWLGRRQIDGG